MNAKREIQDYYGQPAWQDEQGSWYSADGRRLLRAGGGGSTSLVLQEGQEAAALAHGLSLLLSKENTRETQNNNQMQVNNVQQFGAQSVYVELNQGTIYMAEDYAKDPVSAFEYGSSDLLGYEPRIQPEIPRQEVHLIQEWIRQEANPEEKSSRLALLSGKAGIGKSIVMHKLLDSLQANKSYLVLGIKSDLIEFTDTEELRQKLYLNRPIDVVIREQVSNYERVVLLVDQIDALSLSLSANRTSLRSLLKLIGQIKDIPRVRIVISCRPYDLEYDPALRDLKITQKWELQELSQEQVLQTLKENGHDEELSAPLVHFLGNPLHLYLFLKVKPEEQLTVPLSTTLLYHQLWSKYVSGTEGCRGDGRSLCSLLDVLADTMYQRQELSVHKREFETEYGGVLNYLLTNGLLTQARSGQIQFFHQTLFDYVYARRFLERGGKLLELLQKQHQGLFVRASVRSILMFLREWNPKEYICTVRDLLFGRDASEASRYRFHLKSLVLHTLVCFENPLAEEVDLISRKIYADEVYMEIIFGAVYTKNWFNALWKIIDEKGGWQRLANKYREETKKMCLKFFWREADLVLERLMMILDFDKDDDRRYLERVLSYYELKSACSSDRLTALYTKLVKGRNPLEFANLLKSIVYENPEFVCEELKENIRLQLQKKKEIIGSKVSISYDVQKVYQVLVKVHWEIAIPFLIEVLTLFDEQKQYEVGGERIYNFSPFLKFERGSDGGFHHDFVEDVMNLLINILMEHREEEKVEKYLVELGNSRYGELVFIALWVYTACPELFKDELCELLVQRKVLYDAPCWVQYQAVEALKTSWKWLSHGQKQLVVNRILKIKDQGEYKWCKEETEWRRKYGHPYLNIGLHKGVALKAIPLEELRELSWDAYQERLRMERKFRPEFLVKQKPISMSCTCGHSSLKQEQGMRMSPGAWLNSMLWYTDDGASTSGRRPTLTGQCELFQRVVEQTPDKFIELSKQIALDDRIPIAYPLAALEGFVLAGRIEEAVVMLERVLSAIDHDIHSKKRGFNIHRLLWAIKGMVGQAEIPEVVVQLLCNTLQYAEEVEPREEQNVEDIITIGINQLRGRAGFMLVECAQEGSKHGEKIFSAIEAIADTASVYTRAAILSNMAYLDCLDRNRTIRLFKRLMHDYDPRLMAMPVSNYHPLVYFASRAVNDLMEFFRRAMDYPQCYPKQVIGLWIAWFYNDRDVKIQDMLDRMCDASEEAREKLLRWLGRLETGITQDVLHYILRFMESRFDSPQLGEVFDFMYHRIAKWPEEYQIQVTEAYVNSPLSKHRIHTLVDFLGGYAIKDPVQTLRWLEKIRTSVSHDEFHIENKVVEVILQAYNGIKSFNESDSQELLESAMDLVDEIMKHPNNRDMMVSFMNTLDNG